MANKTINWSEKNVLVKCGNLFPSKTSPLILQDIKKKNQVRFSQTKELNLMHKVLKKKSVTAISATMSRIFSVHNHNCGHIVSIIPQFDKM